MPFSNAKISFLARFSLKESEFESSDVYKKKKQKKAPELLNNDF